MGVHIMHPKMKKTGNSGENQGVNDIGAHHDFRLKAIEQQKHHHDDAA